MVSTAAPALLAAMCFVLLHSSMGQQPVPTNCHDHYTAPTPVSTPPTPTPAPLAPTPTPAAPPPTPASTPLTPAPAPSSAPTPTPAAPPPTPVSTPPTPAPAPSSAPTPTPAAPPPTSDCYNSCPSQCNTICTNYRDAGLRQCDAQAAGAFGSCYDSCTSRTCPGKSCVHSGCTSGNCTCENANARSCCETCGRAASSAYSYCRGSVDGGSHMYYCMLACISNCNKNCV